ncbi:MAG: FadR family transcriptional regulator, partial [Oscillospiraceae bacterium]|nr:FadR family transcriptional regulator [Oscillospiraceae bacterium]
MRTEKKAATCSIVVDYIINQITNRSLNLGDRLEPERTIADKLNVSRATVREAINILNYIGFIDSAQGSGNYVVNDYSRTVSMIMRTMYLREDISQTALTDFRQMLELHAFELAMQRITESQLDELEQILKLLDISNDDALIISLDNSFHRQLVIAAGDPLVRINFDALSSVIQQNMSDSYHGTVIKKTGGFSSIQKYHHLILEALKEKDLEKGKQALVEHFKLSSNR